MDNKGKLKLWSEISDFEKFLIIHVFVESEEINESILIDYYNHENIKIKNLSNTAEISSEGLNADDTDFLNYFIREEYKLAILPDKFSKENFYSLLFQIPYPNYNSEYFLLNVLFPCLCQISVVELNNSNLIYKWMPSRIQWTPSGMSRGNKPINNLRFLTFFENIEILNFNSFECIDFSDIKKLIKLRIVKLTGINQEIKNLEIFLGLPLEVLHLNKIYIKNIDGIGKFNHLKELIVTGDYNRISELSNLRHLVRLHLLSSQIYDLEPLIFLQELEEIKLSSNLINDFYPISQLKKLSILSIEKSEVSDIGFLKNLSNIKILSLKQNNIKDIQVLNELINIEDLDLSFNQIENYFLKRLNKIRYLNLSHNHLKSLKNINYTEIIQLDISNNPLTSLNGLEKAIKLMFLDMNELNLVNIWPILELFKEHGSEVKYEATKIKDVKSEIEFLQTHKKIKIVKDSLIFFGRNALNKGYDLELLKRHIQFLKSRNK